MRCLCVKALKVPPVLSALCDDIQAHRIYCAAVIILSSMSLTSSSRLAYLPPGIHLKVILHIPLLSTKKVH